MRTEAYMDEKPVGKRYIRPDITPPEMQMEIDMAHPNAPAATVPCAAISAAAGKSEWIKPKRGGFDETGKC